MVQASIRRGLWGGGGACVLAIIVVLTITRGEWLRLDVGGPKTDSVTSRIATQQSGLNAAAGTAEPSITSVGSAVCASCHTNQHQSYLLTAHSRAMGQVVADEEPPDGDYFHEASARHYSIFRRDGQLWHAESGKPSAAEAGAREQQDSAPEIQEPLKYLVGSGRHSRTYLVELDGFLMESPVTWYSSTKSWSMSPGYNHAGHAGFERAADFGCLVCHVGTAEPVGGALNRLLISETAIGCERCHGPGAAHVEKWRQPAGSETRAVQSPDDSIIHPGRLSRELQEAICSQCHLRGDATVLLPGKTVSDFRPGQVLTETRIDYQLESKSGDMTVVGHVDQMHASRCYQQSSAMTCTTCHDSHAERLPEDSLSFYRNKCLECHTSDSCGVSTFERQKQEATDNCVRCHMPQAPTDIPHIAFTHHRIGVHDKTSKVGSEGRLPGRLVPFGDVSALSEMQQQRSLGLAYVELLDRGVPRETVPYYRGLARKLLEEVASSEQADGDVFAALARFAWEDENPRQAQAYAQKALAAPGVSPKARVNSLLISGDCYLQNRQSSRAVEPLEELVKLRRSSQDWLLLGISRFQSGQKQAGIMAVQQATRIQPFRSDLQSTLSEMQRAAAQ